MQDKGMPDFIERICTTLLIPVLATWYICSEKVTVKREHAFTDCKRRAAQVNMDAIPNLV
jgi:hypothetical protein